MPKEGWAHNPHMAFGMTMKKTLRPGFLWSHISTQHQLRWLVTVYLCCFFKSNYSVKDQCLECCNDRKAKTKMDTLMIDTLFLKKRQFFDSCLSFGEEFIPVNLGLQIISTTKPSRPYVRVSDPGAQGKMERLKLHFFRNVVDI